MASPLRLLCPDVFAELEKLAEDHVTDHVTHTGDHATDIGDHVIDSDSVAQGHVTNAGDHMTGGDRQMTSVESHVTSTGDHMTRDDNSLATNESSGDHVTTARDHTPTT